ncbi:hypothetical protein [Longimicrobium sp.]|uniref:hypothetical protein n=1 Tax=Longimicrobium sp. TaxID=2029185 RepID=UPI003B3B4A66
MKLGRLSRNARERNPVRAAIATVLIGLFILVQGIQADMEGIGGGLWYGVALVFFALAVPVYAGSDEAGLAVIGIFILLVVLVVMITGPRILFPWPLIMGAVLWAGMRGVATRNPNPPASRARDG